jgi:hypothetical protein
VNTAAFKHVLTNLDNESLTVLVLRILYSELGLNPKDIRATKVDLNPTLRACAVKQIGFIENKGRQIKTIQADWRACAAEDWHLADFLGEHAPVEGVEDYEADIRNWKAEHQNERTGIETLFEHDAYDQTPKARGGFRSPRETPYHKTDWKTFCKS